MLEDAIKSQQFERVAALLEQGFSPNGERGSSKVGCVLTSKSTSSVFTLTNINSLQNPREIDDDYVRWSMATKSLVLC